MRFHPRILPAWLVCFLVLVGLAAGCRKSVIPEEQEEMLRKCHHIAKTFDEDLQITRTKLLPLLTTLNQPKLVGKLKDAVTKAKTAHTQLVEVLEKAQQNPLMSEGQAGELTKVLKQVQAAQHTLRDVMEEARQHLTEQLKRRPKPA